MNLKAKSLVAGSLDNKRFKNTQGLFYLENTVYFARIVALLR